MSNSDSADTPILWSGPPIKPIDSATKLHVMDLRRTMAAPLLQDLKAQSGSGHSVIPRYCDVSSPLPAYPEDIERWRGKAAKNGVQGRRRCRRSGFCHVTTTRPTACTTIPTNEFKLNFDLIPRVVVFFFGYDDKNKIGPIGPF